MNQEQQNFLGLLSKTMPKDPTITTIDIAANEKKAAAFRKAQDKANPVEPVPAKVELARLRSQLFKLQETAKSLEVKVNNEAGNVMLFESNIKKLLVAKKTAEAAGNLLGARNYEHQIQLLETELADAQARLVNERRYNGAAVRELLAFKKEFGPRIEELTKEVG
jgi:hypothetical protein